MADETSRSAAQRFGGYAVLGVVAVAVVAVGIWLFASGGGDDDDGLIRAGDDATPASRGEATATPVEPIELGVLDSHRPAVGEAAPDFALVDARDGVTVRKLSDFRGTPVVLNWYATWCGPCRAEIPDFQQAQDALGDRVVFIGVNLQESQGDAVGLLEELDATYPALLDTDGEVAMHYRLLGMPTTYFIDAEGNVVAFGAGRIVEETLVEELAKLGLDYTPPES